MAHTAGDFSPSTMGKVILKETQMLNGEGRSLSELNQPIVAGQAILAHQDPEIVERFEGQTCIEAKVVALRSTNDVVDNANAAINCAIPDSTEAGSEALTLSKTVLTNPYRFTIKEKECHNAFTWEERLAYNMMKAKVSLEIALTKKLVALASTEADTPDAAWFVKSTGDVVGNSFNVEEQNFTSDLYADILYASQLNDINSPILVNGVNFFHDTFLQKFKGMACCDNDGVLNGQTWPVYFDIKNVDTTVGAKTSLVLDKNALLFWSSPVFTNTAPVLMTDDTYVWQETLPRFQYMANGGMQDIYVDVRAQKKCLDGHTDIQWNFELVLRGALSANLANSNDQQGILKITQVANA